MLLPTMGRGWNLATQDFYVRRRAWHLAGAQKTLAIFISASSRKAAILVGEDTHTHSGL